MPSTMSRPLLLLPLLLLSCSPPKSTTTPSRTNLSVQALEYDDGELSGELRNTSSSTYTLVHLEVTWSSPCGKRLMTRSFQVVPGPEKAPLKPNTTKPFSYKAKLRWRGRRAPVLTYTITTTQKREQ